MISHKLPVRDLESAEIGASLISLAPALPEELLLQQEGNHKDLSKPRLSGQTSQTGSTTNQF